MSRSAASTAQVHHGGTWVVLVIVPVVAISTSVLTLLFALTMFGPLAR